MRCLTFFSITFSLILNGNINPMSAELFLIKKTPHYYSTSLLFVAKSFNVAF
jgi:hypothetical protein